MDNLGNFGSTHNDPRWAKSPESRVTACWLIPCRRGILSPRSVAAERNADTLGFTPSFGLAPQAV
jgi:hypothetical protein